MRKDPAPVKPRTRENAYHFSEQWFVVAPIDGEQGLRRILA